MRDSFTRRQSSRFLAMLAAISFSGFSDHGFPQFIATIDNWITAAVDTHTK